ncbi:FixH family protein [Ammoniphilus resinae]|uniref:YtkA-like domain-containing protein n=1 Tax=Ammoniphilus resinae TaxID=861532 RepID=A0ABS4GP66_9BACL|nr:FixH family protein [Ammoniphilus resinae]MBP1932072.1 hypothetical protein [Ammoniphilus resinae]
MKKLLMVCTIFTLGLMVGCSGGDSAGSPSDQVGSASADAPVKLEDIKVSLEAAKNPVLTGEMTLYTVKLQDQKGNPAAVDSVHVYLNMDMMNHPTQGTMKEAGEGVYTVELPVGMEGEWYTIITLSKGDMKREIKEFKVQAKGEKHMDLMTGYNADKDEQQPPNH